MIVILLILWVILSLVVGEAARSKGRGYILWIIFSLIFSPIIAVIFLLPFSNLRNENMSDKILDILYGIYKENVEITDKDIEK